MTCNIYYIYVSIALFGIAHAMLFWAPGPHFLARSKARWCDNWCLHRRCFSQILIKGAWSTSRIFWTKSTVLPLPRSHWRTFDRGYLRYLTDGFHLWHLRIARAELQSTLQSIADSSCLSKATEVPYPKIKISIIFHAFLSLKASKLAVDRRQSSSQ